MHACVLLTILFVTPIVPQLFTLSVLFAEPRVDKTRAKRLEGDLRSHGNFRLAYFLGWHGSQNIASLADTAAIAVATT